MWTSRTSRWAPGTDGQPVYLRDIWPTDAEVQEVIRQAIDDDMYARRYADVFAGDSTWQNLPTPTGATFAWDADSTYVRKPPYFEGMQPRARRRWQMSTVPECLQSSGTR
jgi:aconitate hydratase